MKGIKNICYVLFFIIAGRGLGWAQCALAFNVYSEFNCLSGTAFASVTIVNPGTPPYTYSWSPIGVTTYSASNLGIGTYFVYVKDANNCIIQSQLTVNNVYAAASVVLSPTNVSCFGGSNGAGSIGVGNPFIPPYTYTWTGMGMPTQTTQTATNLVAGIYTVSLLDSKGCATTNSVQITEPGLMVSSLSNTFISCFGGTINSLINTSGGVGPYTYSVNGTSVSGSTATALGAGTHTIITKDSKGCSATNTAQIFEAAQPVITFSVTSPFCPGNADGAVSATVSGAPAPYTYSWQPINTFTNSVTNIPAGNYTITVKDAGACLTKSVVAVLSAVTINATVSTSPENCSAADGTATLNITGGNFPYSFTTTSVGAHASTTLSNLSSGTFTTILKDGNNCRDTVVFNVGNLSTVSVSVQSFTPVLCFNQCSGAIQLSVQNASGTVTYSASGSPTTTGNIISNMCAGFHNIKVVDGNGCPATTFINFPMPPAYSYSASGPSSICYGKNITLQGSASGGTGTYTYVWNPGNLTGQAVSLSPVATTAYSLNVYDSNNCTLAPYIFTITVAPQLSITINSSATGICPGTTAQITPTISGGDGNYNYSWLPGNYTTASILVENINVPTFTLVVNDACGSPTAVKVVTINLFPVIKPTYTLGVSNGCQPFCTQFINTTPKSASAIWNYGDKPFEQQGTVTNYCYENSGIYNIKLTVKDSNLCKTSFTYSNAVTVYASPKVDFGTRPEVVTLNNSENVLFENTTANASRYLWFVEGGKFSTEKNMSYTFNDTGCVSFKLVAANQNNCYDSLQKQICVIEGFNFWMPNCFTPNTDNVNEVFMPKGTGWVAQDYQFMIFNRWGQKVFYTKNILSGWDGKAGDNDYDNSNIYHWKVIVTDNVNSIHELQGHLLLLR
ncbi:MAG: gliding motility-associated C-terminal domain-containing protein [Bacteroidetes bacterium]|nr:gliding motility-associated C-terminal domain-containing protein [Bacteroidota bacterium]